MRSVNPISGDTRRTQYEAHNCLLAWAAAIDAPNSDQTLESEKLSSFLIFRLPSSSVTMCKIYINSWAVSTPIVAFISAVDYENALGRCGD